MLFLEWMDPSSIWCCRWVVSECGASHSRSDSGSAIDWPQCRVAGLGRKPEGWQ